MKGKIPVYINNRNRLTTTRKMVEYLQDVPEALPIIVDNASTYGPLLEWYRHCPVEVVYLATNYGPHAPWSIKEMAIGVPYYAVTDSDLDLADVPIDVLRLLRSGLEKYPGRVKAGLSLETCDLPEHFESTRIVQEWEQRFWKTRLDERWFSANIDTTFALYWSDCRKWPGVGPALRADRPYTARHIPWYRLDNEEEKYFESQAEKQWSTWAAWDEDNPAREVVIRAMGR